MGGKIRAEQATLRGSENKSSSVPGTAPAPGPVSGGSEADPAGRQEQEGPARRRQTEETACSSSSRAVTFPSNTEECSQFFFF